MISCSNYDYIEIVCLYRYLIKLELKNGKIIEGTALDTKRDENKTECIEMEIDNSRALVNLDEISKLTVLVENPNFKEVVFS